MSSDGTASGIKFQRSSRLLLVNRSFPFFPSLSLLPFLFENRSIDREKERESASARLLVVGQLLIKSHKVHGVIAINHRRPTCNRTSIDTCPQLPFRRLDCPHKEREREEEDRSTIVHTTNGFFVSVAKNFQPTASSSGLMPLVPGPGTEFANFGDRDLMLGLTSEEAWVNLTDEDLQVRVARSKDPRFDDEGCFDLRVNSSSPSFVVVAYSL